jgi:hypothetical protein
LVGDDFRWENAQRTYYNIDKLIKYVNLEHAESIIARYSTVNDYLDAMKTVKDIFQIQKTEKFDRDFMPLINKQNGGVNFWTGYYTSRGHFKKLIKDLSGRFHIASNLMAVENFKTKL